MLAKVKRKSTKDYWAEQEKKWAKERTCVEQKRMQKKAKKKALREEANRQREAKME